MRNKLNKTQSMMMFSNLFLVLPVIFAGIYHQWIYCFLASGLLIFSPLYHWYRINNPNSLYFNLFRKCDWLFAVGAFLYMYYYVYQYVSVDYKVIFFALLSLVVLFFWYGYKKSDYEKMHPWFHIVAPIISSAILIVAYTNS
jgi:CDP-diglyceride synthetase